MTTVQDLRHLITLQDIDLRIRDLETAKERYPAAVADLEARIRQARAAHGEAADRLERLSNSLAEMGGDIGRMRENFVRSQERLNAIQTNREYDAVHKEIEAQRHMLGAAEARREHLEADIERCKAAVQENAAAAEKTEAELTPQIEELNAKTKALDSDIAKIMKEREEVTPHISTQALRTYDAIRKKCKGGKAVATVDETKTCSVCFMVLPPHLYNEVRKGSRILLCESCGSILLGATETPLP